MRLIDADALIEQLKTDAKYAITPVASGLLDAAIAVDKQPTIDAVPLKPLCKWLSYYAAPPIIGERINIYDPGERERAWERALREIDWGKEPWTDELSP